jgi:hypothetical protein
MYDIELAFNDIKKNVKPNTFKRNLVSDINKMIKKRDLKKINNEEDNEDDDGIIEFWTTIYLLKRLGDTGATIKFFGDSNVYHIYKNKELFPHDKTVVWVDKKTPIEKSA